MENCGVKVPFDHMTGTQARTSISLCVRSPCYSAGAVWTIAGPICLVTHGSSCGSRIRRRLAALRNQGGETINQRRSSIYKACGRGTSPIRNAVEDADARASAMAATRCRYQVRWPTSVTDRNREVSSDNILTVYGRVISETNHSIPFQG